MLSPFRFWGPKRMWEEAYSSLFDSIPLAGRRTDPVIPSGVGSFQTPQPENVQLQLSLESGYVVV